MVVIDQSGALVVSLAANLGLGWLLILVLWARE